MNVPAKLLVGYCFEYCLRVPSVKGFLRPGLEAMFPTAREKNPRTHIEFRTDDDPPCKYDRGATLNPSKDGGPSTLNS